MPTVPVNQRAGLIHVTVDGVVFDVKGNFTYNLGTNKREAVIGADRIHGFKEQAQVPFIEGQITDRGGLSVKALTNVVDATVVLLAGSGKTIVFRNAWFAGEGNITTEESAIDVRFEALSADEV